ncbi:MAG: type I methionyl aminopeptidase [Candidatus Omnitrophota bacterium]
MVKIKSDPDIQQIRQAGKIVARVLSDVRARIAPEVRTCDLDDYIKDNVEAAGGRCAFLGYRSFPANSCISVNEEVIHGIPSDEKILREGDVVGVDVGVGLNGWFADGAVTYPVGRISEKIRKLLQAGRRALELGIKQAKAGNFLSNISYVIQRYAESCGFSVVRSFTGHGIGRNIHEDPEIPNFGRRDKGMRLRKGMVLAIEPMLNMGGWETEVLPDGWTAVTKDRLPSAHFEHTVVVGDCGAEIVTRL